MKGHGNVQHSIENATKRTKEDTTKHCRFIENKIMHINDKLPSCKMDYVIAYLLYGYLYQPNEIFFLMSTSSNQEAKKFAISLLTQQLEQLEQILNN